MGDTSPRPRPSAAFASGLCLSAQTSWERSAPELVFSSLSPSSTNTLRSLSRSKAKWAAWERCCSKIHTNHFYLLFCSHLFILPPRRHHHHIRRESIVYCEEQKVNASTKLFAQDETKQGKHSADDSMIPLSCSSPPHIDMKIQTWTRCAIADVSSSLRRTRHTSSVRIILWQSTLNFNAINFIARRKFERDARAHSTNPL